MGLCAAVGLLPLAQPLLCGCSFLYPLPRIQMPWHPCGVAFIVCIQPSTYLTCCYDVAATAPAGMQLFWHALQSTTCPSADGLLKLQDGAFFMGDELYGSRMVLRDSYQTLYMRIKDLLRAGLNRRFVVTGAVDLTMKALCMK